MKKILGAVICLLAILFMMSNAKAEASEKALIFPVEYTTNNESKIWQDNNTLLNINLGNEQQKLSKNMSLSFDVLVPKSLLAKSGMVLTLSPFLSANDQDWQWVCDVHPGLEDINITKSGSGYKYYFYNPVKKDNVYVKKYVSINKQGKYLKISVKRIPLLSYGKTDSGKNKSIINLNSKLSFGMAVVGSRKGHAMLYIDNVQVHNGKKVIESDTFNKDSYRLATFNFVKGTLLYISSFNKNKIPSYKKVPDDIRNASSKQYVKRTDSKATACTIKTATKNKAKKMPEATYKSLPSWHGVNLCTMYEYGWLGELYLPPFFTKKLVDEIAEQGFDFIRVTLDSRIFYTKKMNGPAGPFFNGNDKNVNLNVLKNIDDLITWCVDKKIHVCLDCHNTPGGYMIGGDEEASRRLLFTDGSKEQRYFYNFWKLMAERYKGISSNALSFNLYNEPPTFATDEQYSAMMKKAIRDIHGIDADRLIFVDMLDYGKKPSYGLVGEKIVQAMHNYDPNDITHANFDILEDILRGFKGYPRTAYDFDIFHAALVKRMEEIKAFREETGTTVMMQEFGCTNYSNIEDIVKYYNDVLSLAKEYELPWAMYDYDTGTFGYISALETARIPGAHYQKIGENRYVAGEVKDVLHKYM